MWPMRMAGVHLEKIARIENVKVTSAYDISRESVEDFTKTMSAKPYYEDIDNYFSKEMPDAVWILTPPDAHIAAIKKEFGDRLAFFGGMSTQETLPKATPEQVKEKTRWLIETIGQGGGYVFSPAHDVPKDVPAENMVAMVEALQSQ